MRECIGKLVSGDREGGQTDEDLSQEELSYERRNLRHLAAEGPESLHAFSTGLSSDFLPLSL